VRDTKEPGLTLHTCVGLLQFHFEPDTAVRIGRELLQYGTAASAPDPSKMN